MKDCNRKCMRNCRHSGRCSLCTHHRRRSWRYSSRTDHSRNRDTPDTWFGHLRRHCSGKTGNRCTRRPSNIHPLEYRHRLDSISSFPRCSREARPRRRNMALGSNRLLRSKRNPQRSILGPVRTIDVGRDNTTPHHSIDRSSIRYRSIRCRLGPDWGADGLQQSGPHPERSPGHAHAEPFQV